MKTKTRTKTKARTLASETRIAVQTVRKLDAVRIVSDDNIWYVSGTFANGVCKLDRIEGDVTNLNALKLAMTRYLNDRFALPVSSFKFTI